MLRNENFRKSVMNQLLGFQTRELNLETKEEVIKWIIENQLGRRNLTPEMRRYLIGKKYELEKKNKLLNLKQFAPSGKICHSEDHSKTEQKIAEEFKIAPRTARNEKVFDRQEV